jgi:hypothetical protein
MRKPKITLAHDNHRNRGVVSLCFEKDFEVINKVDSFVDAWLNEQNLKLQHSTVNPAGNTPTEICTHLSMKD